MTDNLPLVLLPGMMCDQRLWRAQIDAFKGSRQVVSPSLIGGDSIADIAVSLLRELPPNFSLAGLSMGGIVAFEMLRRAPERVARLALLDTNHRADTPERKHMRDRQMAEVRAGRLKEVLRDELKPNYLAQVHRHNQTLLDEVLGMGLDLGEAVFLAQSQALKTRQDSTATLATIGSPVAVICGDEDALCPVSLHREMSDAIPQSALHIIPDCGHLAPMEQPRRVNELLLAWLAQ